MVFALGVTLQLVAIEIHVAQVAGGIPRRLVAEVRRRRAAALAAGADCFCADAIAELDDGDEAVAAGAVHLLRARIRARAERRERSPPRRGEADRSARFAVIELLDDVAV